MLTFWPVTYRTRIKEETLQAKKEVARLKQKKSANQARRLEPKKERRRVYDELSKQSPD